MSVVIAGVWESASVFQSQIIAFFLTGLGALLKYYLRPTVVLIWGRANNSFHSVATSDQSSVSIYCEKYFVQNTGRKHAEKLEVIFSGDLREVSIFPPRSFEKTNSPSGNSVIKLDYLPPKDILIIDTIHIDQASVNIVEARCTDCVGKCVEFVVMKKVGVKSTYVIYAVFALGVFYFVHLLVSFILFLFIRNLSVGGH